MSDRPSTPACPLPFDPNELVHMMHGGGGRKMAQLIEQLFLPALRNAALEELGDGAVFEVGDERIAFSTDTFVVSPPFFPGGNIGSLAVHGTLNDLAMCAATPLALSLALVLEEGFPIADLERIVASAGAAAAQAGVPIVTGDTKVVQRGKGDGVFVNCTGIGRVIAGTRVGPRNARPGDAILVSGPVGDHGIAVMAARSGLSFAKELLSDSASVLPLVRQLLEVCPETHALRDATRGGLATVLCEIADVSHVSMQIDEALTPVRKEVEVACELLGLDPLYVACEGRFVAFMPAEKADAALAAVQGGPGGEGARIIGRVERPGEVPVLLRTRIGSRRRLERLSGEQLPRIC
ncbi:MAG: hydrogenase expression/formation protein HypE [Phycisphaerae bacterium]